jgi:cytochrome c5
LSSDKNFAPTFAAIIGGLTVLAIILVFVAGILTEEISTYMPDDVVLDNIKPVGEVNIADKGDSEPVAEISAVESSTPAAPAQIASPGQVYQTSCFGCHGTGVAGAPRLGDAAAWAPRIARGMDALLSNTISGVNAMPPKGLCMTCSDDELRAVIEYMVAQSR